MHQEPDVGLDPESPGSCPGPKAGAKPLRHPGIPRNVLSCTPILFHVRLGKLGLTMELENMPAVEIFLSHLILSHHHIAQLEKSVGIC